jgi:hypothetical protein
MTERRESVTTPDFVGGEENLDSLPAAWEKLFSSIAELGRIRDEPANSFMPTTYLKLKKNDPYCEYFLKINPAILSPKGDIVVVVLDVMYREKPSQTWVATAEWLDGKPKFTDMDSSGTTNDGYKFSEGEIVNLADKTVNRYQYLFSIASDPKVFMNAPQGYSMGIN